jgi:hypothetical protein
MIYELRIYEAAPGRLPDLNARFANHTLDFFANYDIGVVGFWTEDVGTNNNLVYILAFQDWADREKKWGQFMKDPGWLAVRAETEKNGPLVSRVENRILRPTPYSPMQ